MVNDFQTYQIYYYYYCLLLHNLIHNYNLSYEWLNLNNYKFKNITGNKYKDFFLKNKFLAKYNSNKKGLGLEILEKGNYFPFFILEDNEKKEKQILLGKHRLYSLLSNKNEIIDKKFLFIKFPYLTIKDIATNQQQQNKYIQSFTFDKGYNNFVIKYYNEMGIFFRNFLYISDNLPNLIYFYKDNILPNPIFNDEKLFEEFINSPFDENNLKIIKQNWKNKKENKNGRF